MPRPTLPLILLSLTLTACNAHNNSPSASATTTTDSFTSHPTKLHTMSDGSRDVLRISAPADADCDTYVGHLFVGTREGKVNIWLVQSAATIDDAVRLVPQKIDSEFKEFKLTSTKTLQLRGDPTPATRLMGSGVEADDFDPGTADVLIFKRAGRIFIACTHGESLHDSAQQLMLNLAETSTAP